MPFDKEKDKMWTNNQHPSKGSMEHGVWSKKVKQDDSEQGCYKMSAVPQKKLCWNCEGNVAREMDNCPYCGVYVHSIELEGAASWNIPYPTPKADKNEEVPTPLYKIYDANDPESTERRSESLESIYEEEPIANQIKRDVLPILLLMSGSIFFLFGIVLLLFSQNGTLTLQWDSSNWPYFLALSIPAVFFGWRYLNQIDSDSAI